MKYYKIISIILLFFTLLTLLGCDNFRNAVYGTSNLELRQLINVIETSSNTSGSFFLIAGRYSSETTSKDVVKMFAKVDGSYRLIEVDLNRVRIVVLKNIQIPYIKIYANVSVEDTKSMSDTQIVNLAQYSSNFYLNHVTIYCSEKYLPEQLLPIKLN